jgi:hypothetical protein
VRHLLILRLWLSALSAANFAALIGLATSTDAIKVSRVTATKHRVLRLRSHIARSTDDLCFINLQLEGVGRYLQRGHVQICGPGDMALVDTIEPFEIANSCDFRIFCFAVPRRLLPRISLYFSLLAGNLNRTEMRSWVTLWVASR